MPEELKSYAVVVDGITYQVRLSEKEAKRRGATPVGKPPVAVKEHEPANKQAEPQNKARKPRTKSEE